MVNNSTNVNKMNNHLSSHIIKHKKKKAMTYDVNGIPNPTYRIVELQAFQ